MLLTMRNVFTSAGIALAFFLCIMHSAFTVDYKSFHYGIHITWGDQNLLTGGPVIGAGIGCIIDYRITNLNNLLLTAGATVFFPYDVHIRNTAAAHIHFDAAYPLIQMKYFYFDIGLGFLYDIIKSDYYNVNELSIALLARFSIPGGNFQPFFQAKLETGGFDTYMLSAGFVFIPV